MVLLSSNKVERFMISMNIPVCWDELICSWNAYNVFLVKVYVVDIQHFLLFGLEFKKNLLYLFIYLGFQL